MPVDLDPAIVQSVRQSYPATIRISELPNVDDIENKEAAENGSYIVLANASTQSNYKKHLSSVKDDIKEEVIQDLNYDPSIYDERFSEIERMIEELEERIDQGGGGGGGGEGGATGIPPTPPQPQITYYFWLIDESHINTYVSGQTLTDTIVSYAVDTANNGCPFKASKTYKAYDIIIDKFGNKEGKLYLIIPKKYIEYDKTSNTELYINSKALTSSGFNFAVESIDETSYMLNDVAYQIVTIANDFNNGLKLTLR